ncbi:MAG: hypothetical protein ACJ77G_15475 [Solirubrobacteraceae bacterium]
MTAVHVSHRVRLAAATEPPNADGSLAARGPCDDHDAEVVLAARAAQRYPLHAVAAYALDAVAVDVGVDAADPAGARLV